MVVVDAPKFETLHAIKHLEKLASGIGSRLAGSRGERWAAEYIERHFRSCGLETSVQEFDFVSDALRVCVGTSAFIVAFIASLFLPPVESAIALVVALIINGLASKLVPKSTSQNVIGIARCGKPKLRVIVGAHHDSAFGRKLHTFPMLALATFVGASILRLFFEPPIPWHAYWALLGVMFLPSHGWRLLIAGLKRGCPGANDNASGVAVMLELARVTARHPPPNVELCFIAFGCEEQGLVGSRAFVAGMPEPRDKVMMLNLDTIGVGELCVIEGGGTMRKCKTSARLNHMLAASCKRLKFRLGRGWTPFSFHDYHPFVRAGIPATALTAGKLGKSRFTHPISKVYGLPVSRVPRYSYAHSSGDTVDKIDPASLERTGMAVLEFIQLSAKMPKG